jgi:hypothetical protein
MVNANPESHGPKVWRVIGLESKFQADIIACSYESALAYMYRLGVKDECDVESTQFLKLNYFALWRYNPANDSSMDALLVTVTREQSFVKRHGEFTDYMTTQFPHDIFWWEAISREQLEMMRSKGVIK